MQKEINMKKQLADVLIELMKNMSLDKITVKDIVDKAGVSRQTFYYYFHDIYEVIEWYLDDLAEKTIGEFNYNEDWIYGYLVVLRWAKANKTILMNIYYSVSREMIEFYLNRTLYDYVLQVVLRKGANRNVTLKQKEFIANFYTMSLNAVTLDWMRKNMKEEPEQLADEIFTLIKGDCERALKKFEVSNKSGYKEKINI